MNQIEEAKENLTRIREDYKNDPELLAIYEPAAKQFVEFLTRSNCDTCQLIKTGGMFEGGICAIHDEVTIWKR